ncbi:hypothetical protein HOI71_00765 [Candidatus Poribacteria bacterium]|nr:hypothetical protein [Candidatus Poribacteria bacterium]
MRSEGTTNRYIDTIDVYVDARTSRFLKLESRWPDGINPSYIEGARHMNAKIREERRIIGPIQVEPPRTRYVVMFEGDHGAESALEKKHIEAYCVDFAWVGFHYGWVMPARHRPARRTPRALRAKETPSPNALATAAGYYAVAWGGMDINTGAPRGPSIYTNGPPMD